MIFLPIQLILRLVNRKLTKIQYTIIQMGCTVPKKGKKYIMPPPSTSAGILKLTIKDGVIFYQAGMFKMDPYIKLKLSNQQKISKIVEKGGKNPEFNQTFTFYINSSNKVYGRNLQVTMMDKKKIGSDNFVGFGLVDLNPVIDLKKAKDQFRCILNCEYKEAGFINIIAEFVEEPCQILNFRFDQAIIRRNTSSFGQMNCWVVITIGEESMKTKKQKDMKKKPPSWQNQIISMKVLDSIKQCEIQVMDDNQEIGHVIIPMEKFNKANDRQSFVEDFVYEEGTYAGTLKFQVFRGAHAYLSQNKDLEKDEKYFGTMMAKNNVPLEQTKGK